MAQLNLTVSFDEALALTLADPTLNGIVAAVANAIVTSDLPAGQYVVYPPNRSVIAAVIAPGPSTPEAFSGDPAVSHATNRTVVVFPPPASTPLTAPVAPAVPPAPQSIADVADDLVTGLSVLATDTKDSELASEPTTVTAEVL